MKDFEIGVAIKENKDEELKLFLWVLYRRDH